MTRFDDKWEDPVSPAMFSPTDEQVDVILHRANQRPINAGTPRRGLVTAAAILVFTIAACAFGVRAVNTLWGERVLNRSGGAPQTILSDGVGAARSEARASEAARPEAAPQAAATEAPAMQMPAANAASDETIEKPALSASGSSQASAPSENGGDMADVSTIRELCARADMIVAGSFDNGVFSVEEALLGEPPSQIAFSEMPALRGWAVLMLENSDEGPVVSVAPYLFRMEDGLLVARDASGAPLEGYDADAEALTLDNLRAICAAIDR